MAPVDWPGAMAVSRDQLTRGAVYIADSEGGWLTWCVDRGSVSKGSFNAAWADVACRTTQHRIRLPVSSRTPEFMPWFMTAPSR